MDRDTAARTFDVLERMCERQTIGTDTWDSLFWDVRLIAGTDHTGQRTYCVRLQAANAGSEASPMELIQVMTWAKEHGLTFIIANGGVELR